jgi:hypothetical protein
MYLARYKQACRHSLVSITAVAIPGININGEKDTMHRFMTGQTDRQTKSNPVTNASMMET